MRENKIEEKLTLIIPVSFVQNPIVHEIGHKFGIVTNLLYADIKEGFGGILIFKATGEKSDMDKMRDFLLSKNIKVI